MPELTEVMTVEADKNQAWDYKSPSAVKIFNMSKKKGSFGFESCQQMAKAIATNIEENDVIKDIELK